eukprot:m.201171 g.201171  ORF g.201171 m.201171 type:complete len:555 (+) comp15743_c0_seq10:141-1805(+)
MAPALQDAEVNQSKPMNWNVKLALIFTFVSTAARGVWAFVTLTNYIKSLTGKVLKVGITEGIQGGLQALAAIVAGIAADYFTRESVLRIAGCIGLLAIGVTLFALMATDDLLLELGGYPDESKNRTENASWVRYLVITVALSTWGVYQGVWNTALETIFADSVSTGDRTQFNTRKFMLLQAANVIGPIIALIMFQVYGDTWYHLTLRDVFAAGVALCVPGAILLFFFSDKLSLGAESDSHIESPIYEETPTPKNSEMEQKPPSDMDLKNLQIRLQSQLKSFGCITTLHIPHIMIFSDLLSGLASGMTIKFFPLYFARKVWLRPVATQSIYIALPFFMIALSKGGAWVAKYIGRVTTSILMAYIGAAALVGLWLLESYGGLGCADCPYSGKTNATSCLQVEGCEWSMVAKDVYSCNPINCGLQDKWYYVIGLYIISTLQHCCRPLKKGILMDYVPKQTRARWNSFDSVTRFGWSGSAVIGGWIISKYDFGYSFLATALLQVLSSTFLFLLYPILPAGDLEKRKPPSKYGPKDEQPLLKDSQYEDGERSINRSVST